MCEQRVHEYPNYRCEDRAGGKPVRKKGSRETWFFFCFVFLRSITSSDHTLNVSISVAAHTPALQRLGIQPVCEMLLPKLPTYITASSSSCSFASDMHTSPSVDPESRRRCERSSAEEEEGEDPDREKCTEVMSSEWVDVCFLSGAAGCRGSLQQSAISNHPIPSSAIFQYNNMCYAYVPVHD